MLKRLTGRGLKSPIGLLLPLIVAALLVQTLFGSSWRTPTTEMTYTEFKSALRFGQIQTATVGIDQITGMLVPAQTDDATKAGAPSPYHTVRVDDPDLLKDLETNHVNAAGQVADNGGILAALGWILPFVLIGIFGYVLLRGMRGATGGAGGPGASSPSARARRASSRVEQTGVTFQSVGGAGEAVDELREITEYLKDPARFQRLGGRMTKGVILVGAPGTGKTLLAKATAGEAGAPFFSVSASEFVEMFVGVGASRVRDLFEQAKKAGPSIIFIDELDAIGGRRAGAGAMGAHEEREQTLNQLLAEMDGFESQHGVIVMAATNRPEVLDPALLRPGRFDRQITVDLPDVIGRQEILTIHATHVILDADADLEAIAADYPRLLGRRPRERGQPGRVGRRASGQEGRRNGRLRRGHRAGGRRFRTADAGDECVGEADGGSARSGPRTRGEPAPQHGPGAQDHHRAARPGAWAIRSSDRSRTAIC